jgi:hypothetical protein
LGKYCLHLQYGILQIAGKTSDISVVNISDLMSEMFRVTTIVTAIFQEFEQFS